MTDDSQAATTATTLPAEHAGSRRRTALVLAGVAAVGIAVGWVAGAGLSDPTKSAEYQRLAGDLEDARAGNTDLRDAVTRANDEKRDARAEVAAMESEVLALDAEREQLEQQAAEIAAREAAVAGAEQAAAARQIPGSGTYRVGIDIEPGTYVSTSGGSCYWARLSGLGGTLSDVIANDNVTGQAVVTVSPSDAAFETSRCGTWERQD